MRKQVLILSDLFPPQFAPRIQAVVKYLPEYGWEPIVVTELIRSEAKYAHQATDSSFQEHCPVHRMDLGAKREGTLGHKGNFALNLLFEEKERRMEQKVRILFPHKPDAILCFAYRKFPLRTAAKLAREWGIPWIADCRDIVEQYTNGDFLPRQVTFMGWPMHCLMQLIRRRIINQRNRYLRQAHKVTTVSPWHKEVLSVINPDTHLIYNGYDKEVFQVNMRPSPTFDIVYTGRLLSLAMRDPSLLFEGLASPALSDLRNSGQLRLRWYTDRQSEELLRPLIKEFNLMGINSFHSMIPREEMAQMIQSASILLQLSNRETENGPHGMVSTKIFEAMAVRKPVLLVRSDEAVMEDLIQDTHIGCAARHVGQVIDFVLNCYKEWKENGYTKVVGNGRRIAQFSRKEQVADFARLLDSLS